MSKCMCYRVIGFASFTSINFDFPELKFYEKRSFKLKKAVLDLLNIWILEAIKLFSLRCKNLF